MAYRRNSDANWIGGALGLLVLVFWAGWLCTFGVVKLTKALSNGATLFADAPSKKQHEALIALALSTFSGGVMSALIPDAVVAPMLFVGGLAAGVGIALWLLTRGATEAKVAGGAVVLGERKGSFGLTPHVVSRETRLRHLWIDGPTGAGKTTLIQNLAFQDAMAPQGLGFLVIDVKDNLISEIANILPPERAGDVVLFDPADTGFPPAFNPFAGVPTEGRTLAAGELLSALKRLYADSWGPRLEHVLRMVILTLLETPDATLLDIIRILTDGSYRAWAVSRVSNFSVREFWEHEFPAIVGSRGSVANVESILNKLGVLAYPEVRNVLGQQRRGLDLRAAMDDGRIVLANLPQGVLGEDAAFFFGALLVGKVQLAAQSRVNAATVRRRPFYLFIDEFQNYQTSAMEKLITEGRSMQVGLVSACQFPEQLPASLRLSLERNCAYALHCRFTNGRFGLEAVKLQEPNASDATLALQPLPPRPRVEGQMRAIRAQSRLTLSRPRAEVEAEIHKSWQGAAAHFAQGTERRRRL